MNIFVAYFKTYPVKLSTTKVVKNGKIIAQQAVAEKKQLIN